MIKNQLKRKKEIIIKKRFLNIFEIASLLNKKVEFISNVLYDNDFLIDLHSLIDINSISKYFLDLFSFKESKEINSSFESDNELDLNINNNIKNIENNIKLFSFKKNKNKTYNTFLFKQKSIVCSIIGYVDNGKTTFLNNLISSESIEVLYKTNIEREFKGMSQKNTGYIINLFSNSKILIIDTPGHQLFEVNRLAAASFSDYIIYIISLKYINNIKNKKSFLQNYLKLINEKKIIFLITHLDCYNKDKELQKNNIYYLLEYFSNFDIDLESKNIDIIGIDYSAKKSYENIINIYNSKDIVSFLKNKFDLFNSNTIYSKDFIVANIVNIKKKILFYTSNDLEFFISKNKTNFNLFDFKSKTFFSLKRKDIKIIFSNKKNNLYLFEIDKSKYNNCIVTDTIYILDSKAYINETNKNKLIYKKTILEDLQKTNFSYKENKLNINILLIGENQFDFIILKKLIDKFDYENSLIINPFSFKLTAEKLFQSLSILRNIINKIDLIIIYSNKSFDAGVKLFRKNNIKNIKFIIENNIYDVKDKLSQNVLDIHINKIKNNSRIIFKIIKIFNFDKFKTYGVEVIFSNYSGKNIIISKDVFCYLESSLKRVTILDIHKKNVSYDKLEIRPKDQISLSFDFENKINFHKDQKLFYL